MATLAQTSYQQVQINGQYLNYTISYSGSTLTVSGSITGYNSAGGQYTLSVNYNGQSKDLCTKPTYTGTMEELNITFSTTFTFYRNVNSLYFYSPTTGTSVIFYTNNGNTQTSQLTVTWTTPNSVPSGTLTVSTPIVIGKNTTISWSNLRDNDGDYVYARQLQFYYKAPSGRYYSSTSLFNAKRTSNSYSHLINESYEGYSCYYVLSISDYTSSSTSSYISTTTLTSPTYTIEAPSGNVFVINSGVITESSGIAVINSGVITPMNGDLHSVVNGVIV